MTGCDTSADRGRSGAARRDRASALARDLAALADPERRRLVLRRRLEAALAGPSTAGGAATAASAAASERIAALAERIADLPRFRERLTPALETPAPTSPSGEAAEPHLAEPDIDDAALDRIEALLRILRADAAALARLGAEAGARRLAGRVLGLVDGTAATAMIAALGQDPRPAAWAARRSAKADAPVAAVRSAPAAAPRGSSAEAAAEGRVVADAIRAEGRAAFEAFAAAYPQPLRALIAALAPMTPAERRALDAPRRAAPAPVSMRETGPRATDRARIEAFEAALQAFARAKADAATDLGGAR